VNSVSPEEVSEDFEAYFLLRPSATREMRRDVALIDRGGPFRFAVRVRFERDVEESIEAVREWFRLRTPTDVQLEAGRARDSRRPGGEAT
jgi:hypothetical protein